MALEYPRCLRCGPIGFRCLALAPARAVQPYSVAPLAAAAAAAAAGDGGHRGRAGPGWPLRRRGASGAPPPTLHGRGQAQAPVVQGRADAAPARGPDPWHAGNTITSSSLAGLSGMIHVCSCMI
jgi:hypothetical protein